MAQDSVIQIVAENPIFRQLLSTLVDGSGLGAVQAADGAEMALIQMRTTRPAAIVADWDMHIVSAIDLLRQVRRDPALGATPVILLVARANAEAAQGALPAGGVTIAGKPVRGPALLYQLEAILPA